MRQSLFIFLVLPLCSFGQNLRILISDLETKQPLPFANIYFKNSGVGASTNMQGLAYFKHSDLMDTDSLIVSYIGYDKHVQHFQKGNETSLIEINIKASQQVLSEVVVKYTKILKPQKIIKTAIKKTTENYSNHAVILNALYRETVEENGTFIQLNEAIVNTHYSGYPQKKLDKTIWEDWFYDDSYAFELEGNRFFNPLLKDFNTKADKQIVVASRHSDNLSNYGIETTLIGDPLLLFAFDKIKYQYDFFNPAILNKYQFEHQTMDVINGEPCYVISFYPKSADRHFRINQSKKNKSPIYIGRLYISKKSFALLRFQYKLAVDRNFGFFQKRMPLDYQVEMNYKKHDQFYCIDNIKFSETKKIGTRENGASILHTANRELYVMGIQSDDVSQFADSLLFKSTQFSSIRHYKKYYNPEYWNQVQLNDSLQLNGKLLADLSRNRSLTSQFQAHKQANRIDLPKPAAFKNFYAFNYHGSEIVDSLHWMAQPINKIKLETHLSAENKYAKNALVEDRKYQKILFNKLNTFYGDQTNKESTIKAGTYFFDEDSLKNEILFYQKDSDKAIEVLNVSLFENKHKDIFISQLIPNPSKNMILVRFERVGIIGDFVSILPFGEHVEVDSISNVYSVQWFSDSTILFSKTNAIGSARTLHHRDIKTKSDRLLYTENDNLFDVEVIKVKNHLFCTIQSKTENEIYLVKPGNTIPKMELIKKRQKGVITDVKINEGIYLLVNDEFAGSSIEFCTFSDVSNPRLLAKSNKQDFIVDILPLKDRIIASVYENSIPKLRYIETGKDNWRDIETKLGIGDYNLISALDSTNGFLFSYSSPSRPGAQYEYSFTTNQLNAVSKPKSINPIYYEYTVCKRIWAKSHDGAKIPITILKSKVSRKNHTGLILKVYGAYGAITTPFFDAEDAILLEQGYTIAYAHVRGESILGQSWYRSGRVLQKENSILDYIHCAEHLVKKGYTKTNLLIGYGNSAGGLIVSQAINLKPDLFNTVILDHPYLDVVNTMMNDTLPLTIDEYKEWGNPQNENVYNYILKYSPYQNIKPQHYPNVLLIAGYYDYQTPIWQIAKYTCRLREHNLSESDIILLTDMNSGHAGNTTGKEWIKIFAEMYSFTKMKNH